MSAVIQGIEPMTGRYGKPGAHLRRLLLPFRRRYSRYVAHNTAPRDSNNRALSQSASINSIFLQHTNNIVSV